MTFPPLCSIKAKIFLDMNNKGMYIKHILIEWRINMAKRINFYLTDIQVKRLQVMSKKTGLTSSEIVRRAIDEYWERFERKEKRK